jgi:uncharacterized membrane protein YqjE
MLGAALKLVALYLINNRLSVAKTGLHTFKEGLADYTESRAEIIRENFQGDVRRIVISFIGFLVITVSFTLFGLLALMWIFAIAWNSPHREVILGITMLIPFLIGLITYGRIKRAWKNKPLMLESIQLITDDWQQFRYGVDANANTPNKGS